jgi:hypothetical protein
MSTRVYRQKVCITHAQREWLLRKAEHAGITLSELMRRIIAAQITRTEKNDKAI